MFLENRFQIRLQSFWQLLLFSLVVLVGNPDKKIACSQLDQYDSGAASSSFGEPVFRLVPPNVINFASSRGATIPCLVSGNPQPSISWYSSTGAGTQLVATNDQLVTANLLPVIHQQQAHSRPVYNVSNLLQILHNGSILRLLPFKDANYRQDIHSTEYRCVASNHLATIYSPSVLVQAVMSQDQEDPQHRVVRVNDEFVVPGGLAVLKCRSQASNHLDQHLHLLDWFTSDGIRLEPGQVSRANKMAAFKSGELHVSGVTLADLQRGYGCRLRNQLTGQVHASSGTARLILTDSIGRPAGASSPAKLPADRPQQPATDLQVAHTVSQLISDEQPNADSSPDRLLLPCAVRPPAVQSRLRWHYQAPRRASKRAPLVPLDQWAAAQGLTFLQLSAESSHANQSNRLQQPQTNTRQVLIAGPTYLAIERPSARLSGRYVCQLELASQSGLEAQTVCDINVIIRQPMRLSVQATTGPSGYSEPALLQRQLDEPASSAWLPSALTSWFSKGEDTQRSRRQVSGGDTEDTELVLGKVRVRGQGQIRPPPLVRVGQSLRLDCLGDGHPIEGTRWFRNGQPLNAQTSMDLQVEIVEGEFDFHGSTNNNESELLSSLLIRQLQPRDAGMLMFECFGYNSLGERARAGLAVFVLEQQLVEWARQWCPLDQPPETEEEEEEPLTGGWPATSIFQRHNPLRTALLLEPEPAELVCPTSQSSDSVEWRRKCTDDEPKELLSAATKTRNSNQLFSGDARFMINGSSLQIRSPSSRHDEALYVCKLTTGGQVHQSSSSAEAGEPTTCSARLNSLLFGDARQPAPGRLSSISIRIVAKLKIDPFEFSRNLEEGMRAVAVCAVISGQSPVDIHWFKDGQLLLVDEQTSLDRANSFTSTLTFHRIRPAHSGLYTCVVSNAFASTNHTSRLLVNVAPYFIEPPKNTKAVLNSNVLINCRAEGQPSPQIRWRKLVALGPNGKPLAPASVGGSKPEAFYSVLNAELPPTELAAPLAGSQQAAPQTMNNQRHEFRIITSNSHIQILENGSMIIRVVEIQDASRYACQAFNGINPSLSQVIDLEVLSPAQFEVNYETVSVKRDAMVKFNCAPRGDQPMRIEWRKEGNPLVPIGEAGLQQGRPTAGDQLLQSKYNELAVLAANLSLSSEPRQRHLSLVLQSNAGGNESEPNRNQLASGLRSSELIINYADRGDTGSFVCSASNAFGKDELTYRLVVQEAPDAPSSLQALNVQSSSLRLVWQAPFDGNLPLTHYIVEHRRLSGQQRQSGGEPQAEWVRLVVSASKLVGSDAPSGGGGGTASNSSGPQIGLAIRQLVPRSSYHMRVAAVNSIGQGAFSAPLSVLTAEEPPGQQANDLRTQPVSSGSLRVLWRGPLVPDEQAPIKGYYVSHRKAGGELTADWLATAPVSAQFNQSAVNGAANYELLLQNLDKNTKYEVRVQPFNSVGVGPASETVGQTLKFDRPGQPQLRLLAARRQSFELKWALPGDPQPLMGFSLYYKCEYDDWQEIQLGLIYHYVIENLRCGNKYQIYLSAFNMVGRSEPSDVLSARTEGTAPVAPDKADFFVRSNVTEVQLDMARWQSGGCPISSFMVQFRRLHDSNWFILSEGATPFAQSDKITIPDLQPGTWYKLMVTALNEAGTTNAEYLFSTLTQDGQQMAPPYPMPSTPLAPDQSYNLAPGSGHLSMLAGLGQLFSGSPSPDTGALLLPLSCLLLLLVTTLASYLYYSRSGPGSRGRPSSTSSASSGGSSSGGSSSLARNKREQKAASLLLHHHQPPLQQSNQTAGFSGALDSVLLSANGTNGSYTLGAPPGQQFYASNGSHCMKLLSGGPLFATPNTATNSSASTHSTGCQFADNTSSQGSSGVKLQLIDESSMMATTNREPSDQLYLQQQLAEQSAHLYSAKQNSPLYSAKTVMPPEQQCNHDDQGTDQECHHLFNQRLVSSSFASAADLLQRQQQQQYFQQQAGDHMQEPIYQRLDRFNSQTLGKQQARSLRFQSNLSQQDPKSMTLLRQTAMNSFQAADQQLLTDFYPPPPPIQQADLATTYSDQQQLSYGFAQNGQCSADYEQQQQQQIAGSSSELQ